MATAMEILLSNSSSSSGVTAAVHLVNSQKYIDTITLVVEDAITNVNVDNDSIVVTCMDDDIVQVEITDISVNTKDIVNVNKEI